MIVEETCPKCGGTLDVLTITTYPPIPARRCRSCGWRWEGEMEQIVRVPFNPPESKETAQLIIWHRVECGLPKAGEVVLITDGVDVGTGYICEHITATGKMMEWSTAFADIEEDKVRWWAPLPRPPKSSYAIWREVKDNV